MEQERSRSTHQIPIDAVDAEDLPRQTAMKYEEVCQIVGDLYFRLHHQEKTQADQFKSVVTELHSRIQDLVQENQKLKSELLRNDDDAGPTSPNPIHNPLGPG